MAHLLQGSVDVGQAGVHVLAERLRRDADILLDQRSGLGGGKKMRSRNEADFLCFMELRGSALEH